jgi:arylsulfatase A-like enzyme/stage V sporulation protein SpoVS
LRSAKTLVSLADTLTASLLLVGTEAVAVGLLYRHHFVDGLELRTGIFHGTVIAFALAAPIAVLGLGARVVLSRATTKRTRLLVMATAALAMGMQTFLVTNGRHFQSIPLRAGVVGLLGVLAGLLAYRFAPALAGRLKRQPTQVGLAAIGVAAAAAIVNALVLPRLYPAFHGGLAILTVLMAPFAALLVQGEQRTPTKGVWLYVLTMGALPVVVAVLVVPWSVRSLAPLENTRFVMSEHAPTVGYAMHYAASDGPPAADAEATIKPIDESAAFSLEGRDIVLISVDALRADHVGAYGYQRPTTPHLDALAKEGVRFEHAYAATPHTSYSVTSMMTGKYMRPLLLQGSDGPHDTFAKLLRVYGYRTAAFYPPAVFFIDPERFAPFRDSGLDFEYRRVEFLPAEERGAQVAKYLDRVKPTRRVFLWAHLFEPHEPYERHERADGPASFGDRDIDRYDDEIVAADRGIGRIVEEVRKRRPNAAFILTADHGEEFGEHGGRFHGTTVYEEQVRVPLVIVAPGILAPHVVKAPVQTVDILPTVLASLRIPRPARVRGHNIGALAAGKIDEAKQAPDQPLGFAFAETEDFTLLAQGDFRLICARRAGACQLFDLPRDPGEQKDASPGNGERRRALRQLLRDTEAQHGRFEVAGLRAEGKAYPDAIRRGIAGDGDAALDIAALLEDADLSFRRKASELLFELARKETAPALRLALTRDEDEQVRRWCALALTRLGEGAGKTLELAEDKDISWRRLASLALAENDDGRGADVLVAWLSGGGVPFERSRQIVAALGKIKAKAAIGALTKCLSDVRLRGLCIDALVDVGDSAGRPPLLDAFAAERRLPLRISLANGLLRLGAGAEMAPPLARFLGTPDSLPGGLSVALRGKFLPSIGGPDDKELVALRRPGTHALHLLVPRGGNGRGGRLLVRGRSRTGTAALVRFGKLVGPDWGRGTQGGGQSPAFVPGTLVEVSLPSQTEAAEIMMETTESWGVSAGQTMAVSVSVPEAAELEAVAVVPLADELPAPPKEPWTPSAEDKGDDIVDE